MGLDFTRIKDHHGAAIILIDDGNDDTRARFDTLQQDLATKTKKQLVRLSSKDSDARQIIQFYQLKGTYFVLLVRDDDQLHHVWSDGERFDASQIAYSAEQAG
jgi:hypothetical protein